MNVLQLAIDGTWDPITPDNAARRLRSAAAYIRSGTWGKGMLCDDNGNVCAVGALLNLRATPTDLVMHLLCTDPVADAAVDALAEHLGGEVPVTPDEVGTRFVNMRLTKQEMAMLIHYLCGYSPAGVEHGLNSADQSRARRREHRRKLKEQSRA
jgi:hypothetical protein